MGVWVLRVERGLQRLQIFAHRAENCGRGLVANAGRDDARAGKAGVKGERRELAGIRRVGSGDDQQRLRASLARHHRLIAEAGIHVQFLPALGRHVLGHVTKHEHDLVAHVQAVVRVVAATAAFGHGESVAGEDDLAFERIVCGERERAEILLHFERGRRFAGAGNEKLVFLRQSFYARGELKRLAIIARGPNWFEAGALELFDNEAGGLLRARLTGVAAFQRVRGEEFHVRLQGRGRNSRRGGSGLGGLRLRRRGGTRCLRRSSRGTSRSSFKRLQCRVVVPSGEEQLRLLIAAAAGRPAKLLTVRREDWQAIETIGERDAHRLARAGGVHQEQFEIVETEFVGREDHVRA